MKIRFFAAAALIASTMTLPVYATTYSFVTVDFPAAYTTRLTGINAGGTIAGLYNATSSSFANGFTDSSGVFSSLSVPGATLGTVTNGINGFGKTVGSYGTGTIFAPDEHGFLDNSGVITTLDDPNAGSQGTAAQGINDAGTIGGLYMDAGGFQHGFLWNSGVFTTQDIAGATNSGIFGINNLGQTVGYYVDAGGAHGYFKNGGSLTTLDALGTNRTYAEAVNDSGTVAGYFNFNLVSQNYNHGFVYSGGVYQQVDVPGALETEILGINDAGQIVGYYFDDPNTVPSVLHGFVGTPIAAPEPGMLSILLSGLVGLAVFHRGRKLSE
jgi:hypothetical protein